jgi:glyoxylase-like metal-dependent hydrolase (beta-lactamase superfamily II)/8-oxo-dGTP pyrophosphatase MutT (NUDIX family)
MAVPATPRPASTVVLVRQGRSGLEALLTQRPSTMAFAPDVHVFPGGALDPSDDDPELLARSPLTPDEASRRLGGELEGAEALALHMAAIRELFEEAGVLLVEAEGKWPSATDIEAARSALLDGTASLGDMCRSLDLRPRPDRLAPLSRWVTPRVVPRRFDAHFFAAELPRDVEPSFATSEVVAHAWMTPGAALEARSAGALGLWVPTSATLQELEHAGSFADIEERLAPGLWGSIEIVDEEPGLIRFVMPAAGGVPGQVVNGYVAGHRELVVVDPGDPSPDVLDAFEALATERDARIRAVAISHVDPDHHGGAEAIAMTLDVPIFAGPGAAAALPYDVTELSDGRRLPVGDMHLSAIETPGHRADHISFESRDGWILAGDAVGPGPGRSIVGEPDVKAWMASLDRLEAASVRRLFPGHGEPQADAAATIADARAGLTSLPTREAQS